MTSKKDILDEIKVSRRGLLQTGGLFAAASSLSLPFSYKVLAADFVQNPNDVRDTAKIVDDRVVWNSCTVDCGSRCLLRMHMKDNEVYWVESDTTTPDDYNGIHQIRACLRGRSIRRRMNHPDRLKYPMKRVGKRGEGKFERISWDEALDAVANSLKETVAKYGNESVHVLYATGVAGGNVTNSSLPQRLMNCYGGFLSGYGDYSTSQITFGLNYMYGSMDGNGPDDIENSKLVVMFGNNPGETRMSGGGVTYYLEQARLKSNARMIIIDPRYTDTGAGREDQWIPIRPQTDGALCAAVAYVLITKNMVDKPFLDKYCIGYDETTLPKSAPPNGHYKAYILGDGADGIPKTPEWASQITGIPPEIIVKLAYEIGSAKPAFICQGWGPQRHSNGEQTSRAIAMLAVLTGNVGIHGGNSGSSEGYYDLGVEMFSMLDNPVQAAIPCFLWTDAIVNPTEMTDITHGVTGKKQLEVPIKFIWCYATNMLINQHSHVARTHEIISDDTKCETIVLIDHFLTSSAKYCDILLPDLMVTEQEDLIPHESCGDMAYCILGQPSADAKFERKPIYWIFSEVAKRLGPEVYQKFTEGKTQSEWVQYLCAKTKENHPNMPTYEEMKTVGVYKEECPDHHFVAFKDFRDDPKKNPLTTPSGKIEIYSEGLATIAKTWKLNPGDVIDPLPVYAAGFEGWEDPARKDFPLQLSGFHYKARVHSTYANVDVIAAACPQYVWINPMDAAKRNIKNGDKVRIFNKRGETITMAKVTPRVMPGVTAMGEGMWLKADMFGDKVDKGGLMNVLTTERPSPLAKGNPSHSNLVEIEKYIEV